VLILVVLCVKLSKLSEADFCYQNLRLKIQVVFCVVTLCSDVDTYYVSTWCHNPENHEIFGFFIGVETFSVLLYGPLIF
jgi:hypothetical protein